MNRRVTSPERVTSPTWGPPPPCKQALNLSTTVTLATEESGRCREVLNKSQSFVRREKKCGRYRKVGVGGGSTV